MRTFLLAALLLVGLAMPCAADDHADIVSAATSLTTAWRTADAALEDRVLHPDFRLTTLQDDPAGRRVNLDTREHLIAIMANIQPGAWDDRLSDIRVHIDSNGLATLWARYVFAIEGAPHHCGHVSMQLYKTPDGWKIISFADSHNNLDGRAVRAVCP
jgi:hypothetical protein